MFALSGTLVRITRSGGPKPEKLCFIICSLEVNRSMLTTSMMDRRGNIQFFVDESWFHALGYELNSTTNNSITLKKDPK